MSGTALDHPLVRGYLRDLDAAMRSLPAAQARELREQITAHLDDLSAAYAARRGTGPVPMTLAHARSATDAAVGAVRADGSGIGAGYQPEAVHDLDALLASFTHLGAIRQALSSADVPPSQVIRIYTGSLIGPANTFSVAVGGGADDATLQGTFTTLAPLLRAENQLSMQRAIMYAALSAQPPVLASEDLIDLQQADARESADLADFNASASTAEQELFSNTVSGRAVDDATSDQIMAEQKASASPPQPLTGDTGLNAATWYRDISITIGDTRKVTGQLTSQVTARADTLKSNATRSLLLISIAAGVLILLLLAGIRGARVPVR